MKECKGLKDYLTDAMDEDRKMRFVAHLAHCKTCQASVKEDYAISKALSAFPKVNAPTKFAATVMRELVLRKRSRFAWGLYGAAVVLVAALVGVILGGNVSAVAGQATVVVRSLADFGGSLYTVVHNISAILFGALPMGRMAPALAGGIFMALCFVFYKTAFSFSAGRK
ncbi:MAG: hypothetical protein DRJ08_00505 [Acidobacteria bacterium]|nr:MAG: hypothetical protein DRJ14_00540 [Acidobacteriota bacterium]RLE24648.1 MAG: hypothetical protein DRJ08_00505 [Acidobacteriota bacterium]